ncbi:GNAT family N-acetyltransferase [Aestuariirhabdus litorea]|uniref:N-acetyltransferase n=1 Tax=Aestuariirhabdus litorea TaxID=2528527 RepID=A0A3P3VKW8_9GAMM|nr:N-acetyltransferase [Aestuariirhabdus litorea]RRJ83391.1 N-acetyltransferase [Aestuariirhabdus litorea]RWW93552.1 GNAT family N-acetyltransferase [Endozoicomonadaceae bacterium GTF-13]
MTLTIRPEKPADAEAIETVTIEAFLKAPHTDHREQFIVRALREAGALTISLVAEERGHIVGHVAVSPVTLSDGSTGWFGLGPISVLPDHQRSGMGSRLMREALGALQALGASGCVVLGDPAYYGRFGFRPEAGLVLPGVPAEYFQALPLGDALPRGVVSYHPAFEASG